LLIWSCSLNCRLIVVLLVVLSGFRRFCSNWSQDYATFQPNPSEHTRHDYVCLTTAFAQRRMRGEVHSYKSGARRLWRKKARASGIEPRTKEAKREMLTSLTFREQRELHDPLQ
jgi:hypothetical protein